MEDTSERPFIKGAVGEKHGGISRRTFLKGAAVATGVVATGILGKKAIEGIVSENSNNWMGESISDDKYEATLEGITTKEIQYPIEIRTLPNEGADLISEKQLEELGFDPHAVHEALRVKGGTFNSALQKGRLHDEKGNYSYGEWAKFTVDTPKGPVNLYSNANYVNYGKKVNDASQNPPKIF